MTSNVSAKMLNAMQILREGYPDITPYRAAKLAGINLTTMYQSPLYKQWRAENKPICDKCGQEVRK